MVGTHSLFFVDNEGAKYSLIRGVSDNDVVDYFVEIFAKEEMSLNACIWICRVPSKSNIADEPSRNVPLKLKLDKLVDLSEKAKTIMWSILKNLKVGRKAAKLPS